MSVDSRPAGATIGAADRQPCHVCQGAPAADAKFVRHTGMLLAWHQMTYRGRWCRDCGTATFRRAQNWNLMLGWWGLASFFLNIYAVLRNLASYNRVRALAAPTGSSQSLQPGRTLVARPGLWVFAVVLVAVLIFFVTRAAH